jgi:hypothetical protein
VNQDYTLSLKRHSRREISLNKETRAEPYAANSTSKIDRRFPEKATTLFPELIQRGRLNYEIITINQLVRNCAGYGTHNN